MNKENVKKWIAALRSGEFKQGKKRLRNLDTMGNKTYCCLGVLCEIADIEIWEGAVLPPVAVADWLGLPIQARYADGLGRSNVATLTFEATESEREVIMDKCGDDVLSLDATVAPREEAYLAALNDKGATFEQIADFIEDHIDSLHVRA